MSAHWGKFLVAGPDATEFLERFYPCHVHNIAEGRIRYALVLNEAGYVFDDGLICSMGPRGYYLTFTSGGAEQAEAWLREWVVEWKLKVHIVNQTSAVGAINVAGPKARDLLAKLCDEPIGKEEFPYARHRVMNVAGVPCRLLRVGFVGELSYELHHPSLQSTRLWDALLSEGKGMGLLPHGIQALLLLRLEKGHIIVGQDTDFDTTPSKLGLDWAAKMEKPYFVGRAALERIAAFPLDMKLVPIGFPGQNTPPEGATLTINGNHIGRLTSSRYSPVLKQGVALGFIHQTNGQFPEKVNAGDATGTVASGPFYDPKGVKLRA